MPDHLAAAVAEVIRSLAAERRMSGRALALASGINARAVDRKLAGQSAFDINDLAAIAPVFDTTPAELLTWAERL